MSLLLNLISPVGMLDLALKSAAILLLAGLAAGALCRSSAANRHLAWTLGVLSLLWLPLLSLALPAWRVTWLPPYTSTNTEVAAVASVTRIPPNQNVVSPREMPQAPLPEPAIIPAEQVAEPANSRSPAASDFMFDALPWLFLAWLAGVFASLLPLLRGLWQLAGVHRRSQMIVDAQWHSLLQTAQRKLAIRRRIRLHQSDESLVPLTWGALRPVLLVPAAAHDWSAERRELVLLHELAHVRRWDWLTQLLAHLACALFWFNPLAWFAARQMRIERERACDDLVLGAGARASDYAQELLTLAASLSDWQLSPLVAVPMARRGALEDRIRGILDASRSRAAVTSVALCLAAMLTAVTLAPLAMLRAAPLESKQPAEKPTEKPAQRDPTADELKARENDIRISVLNAAGDKGIPEFRVIAGVPAGSVSSDFEKRTGRTVINWQPHTCAVGKEGDYVWPLARAYDEMALRVEADGYQPQAFTGIKKANGVQHVVFQLAEDQGVTGRALTPSGRPAADGTVALGLCQKDIVWEEGQLRGAGDPLPEKPGDRWRRPLLVKTDADGRFRLPTESEPAVVLIVHESGVKEIAYDTWKKAPEVALQPWGKVTGRVQWGTKPGANEEVSLSIHRDEYGYPGMLASYARTKSDAQGRFTFERVLPGLAQISRPIQPAGAASGNRVILSGMFQHAKVAGDTQVLLGGQGRKVTGKLAGLASWEGATWRVHPHAPSIGFGGDDAAWQAFGELRQSAQGPLLFRDTQPVNKDGTIVIENLLPGRYQLFVSAPGFKNYAAATQFEVAPETFDEKPAPLDLGEIAKVQPPDDKPAKPAEKPADKPAEKPAAKRITVRGKVLDDETGEPIARLITQAGKFEPTDPTKVTWGYSEGRSSARDGSFSTTIEWSDGWTARILADGYVPQPVVTAAPPADKDEIVVTIRLKRGPKVRGIVLDHAGKPVKDAAVFAVGPTGVNLAAGHARSILGFNDDEAKPARTGADGRFELPSGGAKTLAVTHSSFDAWPAEIPASGEVTIRLPEPARVDLELDIDGADKESTIFYQLLTEGRAEFAGVRIERDLTMPNPGKLALAGLPPGRYQLSRNVRNNLGEIGTGAMLEREFFELKAGETKTIRFVRPKGARIRGKIVAPPETKLMGTVVSIRSLEDRPSPFDSHAWPYTYASQTVAKDGTFQTERIAPGKYRLVAEAYLPLTPEQRVRTGLIRPPLLAELTIDVPEDGELKLADLELKPRPPRE